MSQQRPGKAQTGSTSKAWDPENVHLGSGWAMAGPKGPVERDLEVVTGETGRGQVMQGLGSHTKNSEFYPKGKGYEQGRDTTRLMFQKDNCCVSER